MYERDGNLGTSEKCTVQTNTPFRFAGLVLHMMVVESPSWLGWRGEGQANQNQPVRATELTKGEEKPRALTLTQGPGRRHAQSRPLNTEISGEWIDLGLRLTAPRPAKSGESNSFVAVVVVLGCILV